MPVHDKSLLEANLSIETEVEPNLRDIARNHNCTETVIFKTGK